MRMIGKGSDYDDECDDDIGKDSKVGKGSKKSSKVGKKGMMFVPEYGSLWSPLSPPPQHSPGKGGFDLSIVESSRLERNITNNNNATNTTITTLAVLPVNLTNVTKNDATSNNYRSRTMDAKLIPDDTLIR